MTSFVVRLIGRFVPKVTVACAPLTVAPVASTITDVRLVKPLRSVDISKLVELSPAANFSFTV